MRKIYIISLLSTAIVFCAFSCGFKKVSSRPSAVNNPPEGSIYDFKMVTLTGDTIDFATYKGKKLLLVNTASECGYTPQYKDLQKLHQQYGNKVTILGFPANNFGGQEPGSDEEIAEFCEINYGVTFQMFSKISVKGDDMHPLYQWLSDSEKNGWNNESPNWNFCKYLVDEKGELLKFYASGITPMSEELLKDIR